MTREPATGDLLVALVPTVCWRDKDEGDIPHGDMVVVCSNERYNCVPGIEALDVIHPRFGRVWCLQSDLTFPEQSGDYC